MKPNWHQAHARDLRRGRYSESGRVYLLTTTTTERHPFFADFSLSAAVIRAFHATSFWSPNELLAWVLMPDHWHGLVQLGDNENLSLLMKHFKGVTSRVSRQAAWREGALWQKGFHDHALRHDEALVDAARYVVLNPVRAGLVSRLGDYPFWDAVWLAEK